MSRGPDYPVQTWTGISGPAEQQRLQSREGYIPLPFFKLGLAHFPPLSLSIVDLGKLAHLSIPPMILAYL
jgi:hypothetical protein